MTKKMGNIFLVISMVLYSFLPAFTMTEVSATNIEVDRFEFPYGYIELKVGETVKYPFMVYPENATTRISYDSSDKRIATVDRNGMIRGVKKGTAYIGFYDELSGNSYSLYVVVGTTAEQYLAERMSKVPTNVKYQQYQLGQNPQDLEQILADQVHQYADWEAVHNEVYQENGNYYLKMRIGNEEHGVWSNSKQIKPEIAGIIVNKMTYVMSAGEEINTGLSFTEGANSNIIFNIAQDKSNPVISYGENGVLKALKPGIVSVEMYDKNYKYWSKLDVVVDAETALETLSEQSKINPLEADVEDVYFDDWGSGNGVLDGILENNGLNINWMFWTNYDYQTERYLTSCDKDKKECELDIRKKIEGKVIEYKGTFNFVFKGIYLERTFIPYSTENPSDGYYSTDFHIDKNVATNLLYQLYGVGEPVITTSDSTICTVSNGKITGHKPGICYVEYESGSYKNSQKVIVDKDSLETELQDYLNSLDSDLVLNVTREMAEEDDEAVQVSAIKTIRNLLKDKNLPSLWVSVDVEDVRLGQSTELTVSYQDADVSASRVFTIEFASSPNEDILTRAETILGSLKELYSLTLEDHIAYRLNTNLRGQEDFHDEKMYQYTDIMDLVKSNPSFDFIGDARLGTMDYHGGYMWITYNDVIIGRKDFVGFTYPQYELENGGLTEEQYIEKIKSTVITAYNRARAQAPIAQAFSIFTTSTEPKVKVEFAFEGGRGFYKAAFEDIEVRFVASNERAYANGSISEQKPVINGSANHNSNTITITRIADAEGYEIQRSSDGGKTWPTKHRITTTKLSNKISVGFNTTNHYRVRAFRIENGKKVYSQFSAVKSVKTKLTKTAGLKIGSGTFNSHKISWVKVTHATGYEVQRSTNNKTWTTITRTTATSFTNRSLVTGKTYYYRVRAYKIVSGKRIYGAYSNVISRKPVVKKAVAKTAAVSFNSNRVTVVRVNGATGYEYQVSTDGKKWTVLSRTNRLTFNHNNLKTGTKYQYRVRAYRTVSGKRVYGAFSTVVTRTPTLRVPAISRVTKNAKNHVIAISSVAGASGYEYEVSKDGKTYVVANDSKNLNFTYKQVEKGLTYSYRVRAYRMVSGKKVYSKYSAVKIIVH